MGWVRAQYVCVGFLPRFPLLWLFFFFQREWAVCVCVCNVCVYVGPLYQLLWLLASRLGQWEVCVCVCVYSVCVFFVPVCQLQWLSASRLGQWEVCVCGLCSHSLLRLAFCCVKVDVCGCTLYNHKINILVQNTHKQHHDILRCKLQSSVQYVELPGLSGLPQFFRLWLQE